MSDTSSQTTIDAALSDDGSRLILTRELTRILGEPRAGTDGRHQDEPSLFHDDNLVGTADAAYTVKGTRPDTGPAGVSAIRKGTADGPVEVSRTGIIADRHGDRTHHGDTDKALYVIGAAEQRHWSEVLGGIESGRPGEDFLIDGDINDVEIGAILSIGDPNNGRLQVRVTGVRNPCTTFVHSVGRADWVKVLSVRDRVGIYLSVFTGEATQTGDGVRVVSFLGHRVTYRRWFIHHDPHDAQRLLNSEIFGNCVIADFTKKHVRVAARERVG